MIKMSENKPIVIYSSLKKDRKAINEIVNAGIKCKFFGPIILDDSPVIYFESLDFYGLFGTREFIKKIKKLDYKKR